ncbi:arginine--tRNA ligase, partial [Patescibacteria group bacterium]|nr:arginine--tRNA ligase [Patescibacteria group bacterium]
MFKHIIKKSIEDAVIKLKIKPVDFVVEHPENEDFGDYSTNIAMVLSKKLKKSPMVIAEEITKNIKIESPISKIQVEKPGFINFWLEKTSLLSVLERIQNEKELFGKGNILKHKKIMVEYTDPNPFKEFHIGHLMSNTIGESLSRILYFNGGVVKRACYQGDVGAHTAKALWGLKKILAQNGKEIENLSRKPLREKIEILGKGYAYGAEKYLEDNVAKEEIDELNKAIYKKSDKDIMHLYNLGRKWSLDYFETIYKKLGTKFDYYFFERAVGEKGLLLVKDYLKKGVFEESAGAIIFKGEKYGLHTRVFVNKSGLPTYEAKDLGLPILKNEAFKYDLSIVVTGNEIADYFKVVLKALSIINPNLEKKTKHIPHGMLRLKEEKMSSRTGKVVTAEGLINRVEENIKIKVPDIETKELTPIVIGAIKYSMLRQGPGKDIIFDFKTSLSFEGDSGPYLQYTYARCNSILRNEKLDKGVTMSYAINKDEEKILKHIYKFPEV